MWHDRHIVRSKQVHGGDKGKDTAPAWSTERNFDKSKPPCGIVPAGQIPAGHAYQLVTLLCQLVKYQHSPALPRYQLVTTSKRGHAGHAWGVARCSVRFIGSLGTGTTGVAAMRKNCGVLAGSLPLPSSFTVTNPSCIKITDTLLVCIGS